MADDHLLVGAYALGALDPHETVAFEAHLAHCASCQAEVAELTETAAQLAVAIPAPVGEPLLERVMQQVRATPQLPPRPPPERRINGTPSPPPARFLEPGGPVAPRRRRPGPAARRVLGAAAVIVLALLAGTMASRLLAERAEQDELAAIIADPAARHVALRGGPGAGTVGLHVRPSGDAVLDARSLGPLAPDRTYELWFVDEGNPVRAATFDPDEAGTARVRFRAPVADPEAFGVTIEPAGGSDSPTLPLVFQAEA